MNARTLFRAVNRALDIIFPKHRVVLEDAVGKSLSAKPVTVIDIGGAMGADHRWHPLRARTRFMYFEPDSRSQDAISDGVACDLVVPVGLGGADGERTLHLTQGPFASSLYKPNEAVLRPFSVWPWYRPAGDVAIAVRTLDDVLEDHPEWTPDFIKVDIEGADLEVLEAGEAALGSSFGVQIEVTFLDRNVGAPGYGVVDQWLRARGFVPHLLIREHWVRQNGLWGANSAPQIAWGDAVYFRSENWVLERMKADPAQAQRTLGAFVTILLAYGCHDAALDLVHAARKAELVSVDVADPFERSVRKSVMSPGIFLLRGLLAILIAFLTAGAVWVLGGNKRTAGRNLLMRQAVPFWSAALRLTVREGISRSCLSDK